MPASPSTEELHCATLVIQTAVTKPEALAIVALVVDRPIQRQRTARPFVALDGGAWVEVEIPKFGEPPPLAIDVYSRRSGDHAKLSALSLLARLEDHTGWKVLPDFTV